MDSRAASARSTASEKRFESKASKTILPLTFADRASKSGSLSSKKSNTTSASPFQKAKNAETSMEDRNFYDEIDEDFIERDKVNKRYHFMMSKLNELTFEREKSYTKQIMSSSSPEFCSTSSTSFALSPRDLAASAGNSKLTIKSRSTSEQIKMAPKQQPQQPSHHLSINGKAALPPIVSSNESEKEGAAESGADVEKTADDQTKPAENGEVKTIEKSNKDDKEEQEEEEEEDEDDEDGDDEEDDDDDELELHNIKAPNELLEEFLIYVMEKKWPEAQKLCKFILMYEPHNKTAKEFFPLIKYKVEEKANKNESDEDESDDSDSDSDDDDDDDDDSEFDYDEDDEESDEDDDDSDDEEEEEDEDEKENEMEKKSRGVEIDAVVEEEMKDKVKPSIYLSKDGQHFVQISKLVETNLNESNLNI